MYSIDGNCESQKFNTSGELHAVPNSAQIPHILPPSTGVFAMNDVPRYGRYRYVGTDVTTICACAIMPK